MEKEKQRCYPNLGSVTTSSIFFKIIFQCAAPQKKRPRNRNFNFAKTNVTGLEVICTNTTNK